MGWAYLLISDNCIEMHLTMRRYSLLSVGFFLWSYRCMCLITREYGIPNSLYLAMLLSVTPKFYIIMLKFDTIVLKMGLTNN